MNKEVSTLMKIKQAILGTLGLGVAVVTGLALSNYMPDDKEEKKKQDEPEQQVVVKAGKYAVVKDVKK